MVVAGTAKSGLAVRSMRAREFFVREADARLSRASHAQIVDVAESLAMTVNPSPAPVRQPWQP